MVVIVTRAGKGSPLTNAEVDANFTNLNAGIAAVPVGDVVGPAGGAGDNALARWDSSTGKLLQNSNSYYTDAGNLLLGGPNASIDVQRDGLPAYVRVQSYGGSSEFTGTTARGTLAAPLGVLNGWGLTVISGNGYDGAGFSGVQAQILLRAIEDWTPTRHGTDILFQTTPYGQTTILPRWSITSEGDFFPYSGGNVGNAASRVGRLYASIGDFTTTVLVNHSGAPAPAWIDGQTGLQITGAGGARVEGNAFAQGVFAYETRSAGGTAAAPTPTLGGTWIGAFGARGYGTTAFADGMRAVLAMTASGDWTDSAQATNIYFGVTMQGTKVLSFPWQVNAAGVLGPTGDNAYDLGAPAARVRTVYAGAVDVSGQVYSAGPIYGRDVVQAYSLGGSVFEGVRANTSATAPTPVTAFNALAYFVGKGKTPSGYAPAASIWMESPEAWTDASTPAHINFQTTPIGSNAPVNRWHMHSAGHIYPFVDNAYDIGVNGQRVRGIYGYTAQFANNVYATTAGIGGVVLNVGSVNNTGYMAFFAPDGVTRAGYIGFADNTTKILNFVNEASYQFKFNNDLFVGSEIYFGAGSDKVEPRGRYWSRPAPGTSFTLALSDLGAIIVVNAGAPVTVTIPPNSSVAWPSWARIDLIQYGAGQVSFVAGASVTIHSAGNKLKTNSQWSGVSIVNVNPNEWVLIGDLAA
jgi:hypothetical protein